MELFGLDLCLQNPIHSKKGLCEYMWACGTLTVVAVSLAAAPALAAGDAEYGQYLSSECVTCHRAGAEDAEIRSLNGYDKESFVEIMKLYRTKELENPTMQTVAGRLKDEDIASLAAYFSSLPEEQ